MTFPHQQKKKNGVWKDQNRCKTSQVSDQSTEEHFNKTESSTNKTGKQNQGGGSVVPGHICCMCTYKLINNFPSAFIRIPALATSTRNASLNTFACAFERFNARLCFYPTLTNNPYFFGSCILQPLAVEGYRQAQGIIY